MAEVSNKAKIELLKQQIALLDTIEKTTTGNNANWESYIHSIAPDFYIADGKAEKKARKNVSLSFMRVFRDSVFAGITPSAATLTRIAGHFDRYLNDDSGKLKLDEAFQLTGKNRIGNPIKQEKWLRDDTVVILAMWLQRKISELKGEKLSIDNAAAMIIENWNLKADAEALKKKYIKHGIDKDYENGYYPPTSECIKDLEKAFEDATQFYTDGISPKQDSVWDREGSKSGLKSYLTSMIEQLGNK